MASGRGVTHRPSLPSPSTFPSLTFPALPLCLSPCLSRVPSPFNYPWHRSHKSSPPHPQLSPCSSFHPPSPPWDRFHFFHSVCSTPPSCSKISVLTPTLSMQSVCCLFGIVWLKIETDTHFFWLHTQFSPRQLTAYPPHPCVSPSTHTTACFMFPCILEGSCYFFRNHLL